MSLCNVPGCAKHAPERPRMQAPLCNTHKSQFRRHGHPQQRGVTTAELRPYLAMVKAAVDRNPASNVWQVCAQRWTGLIKHAEGIVEKHRALEASLRGSVRLGVNDKAAWQVLALAKADVTDQVWHTVAAMHLLQEDRPHRFKSDNTFRVQVSRRVRGLTENNAGQWFNAASGRTVRVYRDLSSRAATTLGQWLSDMFGEVGLRIARTRKVDAEKRAEEHAMFHAALTDLQ